MTVTPLNADSLTPEVILDHVKKDIDMVGSIFIVAFSKKGETLQYYSGSAQGCAFAGLIMQDFALRMVQQN